MVQWLKIAVLALILIVFSLLGSAIESNAVGCNLDKSFLQLNISQATCLDCLYNAAKLQAAYQRDNPTALTSCSKSELTNYWCNGGWGIEAKNDCSQKANSSDSRIGICKNECTGANIPQISSAPSPPVKKSQTPTPVVSQSATTATPPPKSDQKGTNLCVELDDKNPSTKKNVIFLPAQYSDKDKFLSDVRTAVDYMSKTNLNDKRDEQTGRPLMDKLKFWAFTDLSRNYEITIGTGELDGVIFWNIQVALESSQSCGGATTYVVFINSNRRAGTGYFGKGAAGMTNADLSILAHELGHSIASLNDEYEVVNEDAPPSCLNDEYEVVNEDAPPSCGYPLAINCSDQDADGSQDVDRPCSKWKEEFPSTGCYSWCTYRNWFKPSQHNIMVDGGKIFDDPSLAGWANVLQFYK